MNEEVKVDKRVIVTTEKLIRKAALAFRNDDNKLTAPNLTAFAKLLDSYQNLITRAQEDEPVDDYERVGMPNLSQEAEIARRIGGRKLSKAQIREIENEVLDR